MNTLTTLSFVFCAVLAIANAGFLHHGSNPGGSVATSSIYTARTYHTVPVISGAYQGNSFSQGGGSGGGSGGSGGNRGGSGGYSGGLGGYGGFYSSGSGSNAGGSGGFGSGGNQGFSSGGFGGQNQGFHG